MKLRDYQQDCAEATLREFQTRHSTLLVLPTGGGKTIIFADVIRRMQPARALVLAHREELIWQAQDKIKKATGLECAIEMADMKADHDLLGGAPVVVATVQTLNSSCGDRTRMSKFDPKQFGLVVCDEAHHSTAKTYKNIFNYFQVNNPDTRFLGVTATPDRADRQALGQVFESVAADYEILDLIHGGWLVKIIQRMFPVAGLDFSHVRTTAGDLNGADLAAVMEAESNIQGVVHPSLEVIFGLQQHALDKIAVQQWPQFLADCQRKPRRTIVFTASVKQAEMLCAIFNRVVPGIADWVCGNTNKDDRRAMLRDFTDGKVSIIVNCGVLTEGFDEPAVEVIVMARPTKSRSLYAQMCGRSTRPLPGLVDGLPTPDERIAAIAASAKPYTRIIDFVGNSGRHKLMTSADILGGHVSDKAVALAKKRALETGPGVDMAKALDQAEADVRQEAEERKRKESSRRAKLVAKVKFTSYDVSPFDALNIRPRSHGHWDRTRRLSDKQRDILLRNGVNPDSIPFGQAHQLLVEIFKRWNQKMATLGQCRVLKRFYHNPEQMTFKEAHSLLDRLAANGWKPLTTEPTKGTK